MDLQVIILCLVNTLVKTSFNRAPNVYNIIGPETQWSSQGQIEADLIFSGGSNQWLLQ